MISFLILNTNNKISLEDFSIGSIEEGIETSISFLQSSNADVLIVVSYNSLIEIFSNFEAIKCSSSN